jgi:hypothetical protein
MDRMDSEARQEPDPDAGGDERLMHLAVFDRNTIRGSKPALAQAAATGCVT